MWGKSWVCSKEKITLTVQKRVHVSFQVGTCWLGAGPNGHRLAVKVVGRRTGLENVGPHILTQSQQKCRITFLTFLYILLYIYAYTQTNEKHGSYVISCHEESHAIRSSSIPLGWDLGFWERVKVDLSVPRQTGHFKTSCQTDHSRFRHKLIEWWCLPKQNGNLGNKDTTSNERHQPRRGERTVKHKPGVQALLTHEVTARTGWNDKAFTSVRPHLTVTGM